MAYDKKAIKEVLDRLNKDRAYYDGLKDLFSVSNGISKIKEWEKFEAITPPGSLIDALIQEIKYNTDFPYEIAYYGTLHYLSAYLLTKDIKIDVLGNKLNCDIWTILLAESGEGKTACQKTLRSLFEEQGKLKITQIEDFTSAAKFVEVLQNTPKGLWVKDEFAQFLNALQTQTYLSEAKGYLLKTYDNDEIVRSTKKDTIRIKEPAISVFGSTVPDTITKYISEEMLKDGFAQRFNYVYCNKRNIEKPLFKKIINNEFVQRLNKTLSLINTSEYILGDEAVKTYERLYFKNREIFCTMSKSFFKRTQFKAIKYATLFHILQYKENNILDSEDVEYGNRLVFAHLYDLNRLFDSYGYQSLNSILQKCLDIAYDLKQKNRRFTARNILAAFPTLFKTSTEVKNILQFVNEVIKEQEETTAALKQSQYEEDPFILPNSTDCFVIA